MTLIEVVMAIALFTFAVAGFTVAYGLLNGRATKMRCDTVASAILRARIDKVLTDPWLSQTRPTDCTVTSGWVAAQADAGDPYDVAGTLTLLSQSDLPQSAFIQGTLTRRTTAFESSAQTVIIDYQIAYRFRSKNYTVSASTVRARDN